MTDNSLIPISDEQSKAACKDIAFKVAARLIRAPTAGSPLIVIPTVPSGAVMLGAVKVWPGEGGARRKVGATANLDSSCARRLCNTAGRDEETEFQVEQRN
jgi:hypothetical protein